MKRKFLILNIIMLLVTSLWTVKVFAAGITSAQVTMTTSKTEYNPGETIEFVISLKNLNADKGIAGFGATLVYDSNTLELNRNAEGCAYWEDAYIGSESNKLVITRGRDNSGSAYSQNNEDIVKIKFTVKEVNNETTLNVSLKNIELSNGTLYRLTKIDSNSITIKPNSTKPDTPDNPDNPSNPDNPDNPDNPNTPDNPDNPSNPDNPNTPDNPDNPSNPDNPNTPDNPDNPSNPDNPDNPGNPTNPSNPNNPDNPDNPSSPDNPNTPDNRDSPDNPNTPDNPNNPNNPPVVNPNINTNTTGNNTTNNLTNSTTGGNVNGNNNNNENILDSKIPQLGTNEYLAILISIAIIAVIILFIRMRTLDIRIKKESKNILEENNKNDEIMNNKNNKQ